ncbi:MAG TPA: universal stress protein [Phenylobacterium sp.]|uniref:universal stress protein n=1 Tax=Phenylobacterium sp. TaxID=1871053 RepID=UPI002F9404A3
MTYRSLLCHVSHKQDHDRHLECALQLADELGAHVIGIGAAMIPPVALGTAGAYLGAGEWVEALQSQIESNLTDSRKIFEEMSGSRSTEWRHSYCDPQTAVTATARAADLVLARRQEVTEPYSELDPGRLLIGLGRPVLLCPPERDYLPKTPALVAWKETRESRRALLDALPLLRRAEDVLVVEVSSNADVALEKARLEDVCAFLRQHGVNATSDVLPDDRSTSDTLMSRARGLGADLIVAGAYGRTRLSEWMFGGVTRRLLAQDQHFVLFSH